MIISAFPGTGKSFYTQQTNSKIITDSDSSLFNKTEFPENYIQHIKQKINENYSIIFVSSHKEVRDALVLNNLEFTLIYPNINLKQEYIQRYTQRGSSESFIKLLENNWDLWIKELQLQQNCKHIELESNQFISNII